MSTGPDHQRSAWMHFPVDQQLRHRIQYDSDGDQVTDGGEATAQQIPAIYPTDEQAEDVRGAPRSGVTQAGAPPQEDGHHRLKHKPEPSRTRETLRQFVEKLLREQIHAAGLERVAHGRWD